MRRESLLFSKFPTHGTYCSFAISRPRLPLAKVSLLGGIIRVYSETENKTYHIPAKRFRPYFRYDDDETIRHEVEQATRDYNRSVLKHALSWLNDREIPALPVISDGDAVTLAHEYVDLYSLACRHDARDLQNAIMDRLIERDTCPQGYFARRLIKRVYECTVAGSKLRKYLVDTFIFKSNSWEDGEVATWVQRQSEYKNTAFVADVECAWEKALSIGRVEDPNRKGKCAYHYHFRGKRCL